MPPAAVATIGLPQAIASSSEVPSPSVTELIDEHVEPLDAAEHVGAEARQQHVLLEVVLADLPLERLAQLAFAEDRRTARRAPAGRPSAAASIRWRWPLCGTSAATLPTTGASCGSQNASCTFTGGAASHVLDVDAFVHRRPCAPAGTPSATSIVRIASDAQMKQSTWRYFQRESELPLRWKSTRRDATSGGFAELACSSTAPAPPSRRRADRGRG